MKIFMPLIALSILVSCSHTKDIYRKTASAQEETSEYDRARFNGAYIFVSGDGGAIEYKREGIRPYYHYKEEQIAANEFCPAKISIESTDQDIIIVKTGETPFMYLKDKTFKYSGGITGYFFGDNYSKKYKSKEDWIYNEELIHGSEVKYQLKKVESGMLKLDHVRNYPRGESGVDSDVSCNYKKMN